MRNLQGWEDSYIFELPAIIYDNLKELKETRKHQTLNYRNNSDKILYVLFLIGVSLAIWGIEIYRLTIINLPTLFLITIIGTITAFIVINKILESSFKKHYILILSAAVGGGIFFFSALFLNQFFAKEDSQKNEYKIIESGNLGRGGRSRCSKPFAVVDIKGTDKELIFPCKYENSIKNFSKVHLTCKKGLFGFDIILSKELRP